MKFSDIENNNKIFLYAGENFYEKWDEYKSKTNLNWIGIWKDMGSDIKTQNLGLISTKNPAEKYNIKHDLTKKHNIPDNCVDIYQSEDVFEHIEYDLLENTINDIFRILKPGGLLRISIPDYNQKSMIERCIKNKNGEIIFDPSGGGKYENGKVIDGGHVWFPTIDNVKILLEKTNFKNINYLSYYKNNNHYHAEIDFNLGYIKRSPKFSSKHSIIIDLYK